MAEACRDRRRGVWWGVGGLARGGKGGAQRCCGAHTRWELWVGLPYL